MSRRRRLGRLVVHGHRPATSVHFPLAQVQSPHWLGVRQKCPQLLPDRVDCGPVVAAAAAVDVGQRAHEVERGFPLERAILTGRISLNFHIMSIAESVFMY